MFKNTRQDTRLLLDMAPGPQDSSGKEGTHAKTVQYHSMAFILITAFGSILSDKLAHCSRRIQNPNDKVDGFKGTMFYHAHGL